MCLQAFKNLQILELLFKPYSFGICVLLLGRYLHLGLNDYVRAHRACLHGGGGWSPYLSCKSDQITVKMRDYMERQVTPPK